MQLWCDWSLVKRCFAEWRFRGCEQTRLEKATAKWCRFVKLISNVEGIEVFVKTVSGKTITLDLKESSTVEAMKLQIEDKEGTPPAEQMLYYAGKQLKQGTLEENDMKDKDTAHLFVRGRGGAKVIKHTVKATATRRVIAGDQQSFGHLHHVCMQIHDAANVNINEVIRQMPIDEIRALSTYLQEKNGKTTNKVKMAGLFEKLPHFVVMNNAVEKVSLAMARFRELVATDLEERYTDDNGTAQFDALKTYVATELARAEERVGVPAAAPVARDVNMG